jgi:hypothetical protein
MSSTDILIYFHFFYILSSWFFVVAQAIGNHVIIW